MIVILHISSFHSVKYISKYVLLPFLNFDVCIFIKGASHYNLENSLFNSISVQFSSVQLLSCVRLFVTPWTAACQATLSITNSQSLPKLMSIESVMPSNNLILCRPIQIQWWKTNHFPKMITTVESGWKAQTLHFWSN